MLETAAKFGAATFRTDVSPLYVDFQFSSLRTMSPSNPVRTLARRSFKRLKHNIWREEIKEMMYNGSLSRAKKAGANFDVRMKKDGVFDLISIDAYFTRRVIPLVRMYEKMGPELDWKVRKRGFRKERRSGVHMPNAVTWLSSLRSFLSWR